MSRAIINSGHFISSDLKVEHERMQATLHLMVGFTAYKIKSPYHSLVIARVNEHVSCRLLVESLLRLTLSEKSLCVMPQLILTGVKYPFSF